MCRRPAESNISVPLCESSQSQSSSQSPVSRSQNPASVASPGNCAGFLWHFNWHTSCYTRPHTHTRSFSFLFMSSFSLKKMRTPYLLIINLFNYSRKVWQAGLIFSQINKRDVCTCVCVYVWLQYTHVDRHAVFSTCNRIPPIFKPEIQFKEVKTTYKLYIRHLSSLLTLKIVVWGFLVLSNYCFQVQEWTFKLNSSQIKKS